MFVLHHLDHNVCKLKFEVLENKFIIICKFSVCFVVCLDLGFCIMHRLLFQTA